MSTGPTKPLAEVAALALQLAPIEKGRIQADTLTRLVAVLDAPGSVFTETPFYRRIAATLARVDRALVPDMPDCIIAATAVYLGVPVISRDGRIQSSGVTSVW